MAMEVWCWKYHIIFILSRIPGSRQRSQAALACCPVPPLLISSGVKIPPVAATVEFLVSGWGVTPEGPSSAQARSYYQLSCLVPNGVASLIPDRSVCRKKKTSGNARRKVFEKDYILILWIGQEKREQLFVRFDGQEKRAIFSSMYFISQ
jgi:hypothetical protein